MKKTRRMRAFAALAAAGLLAAALAAFFEPAERLPTLEQVRAARGRSDAVLLDRRGDVVHRLRVDPKGRRLEWMPLDAISPALRSAIVAAEDRRFYEHRGVDARSIAASLLRGLWTARLRGASTITMQVAAKLLGDGRPAGRRTLRDKWRQMRAARRLERTWTKGEILEAYLNLISFRGELEGVAAASEGLFRKKAHGLDEVESLILAALVRAPNAPIEAALRRARALAETTGVRANAAEIQSRAEAALGQPYFVPNDVQLAPHVAAKLLSDRGGSRRLARVSTLDGGLQRAAAESLRRHLAGLRAQNVRDGAVLAVENSSGDVLAYVGNSGDGSSARYVDGIQAYRQAGSTLKPFIYGAALERRYLTAATLLDDSPLEIPVIGGVYRPKNYDRQFHGVVSVRTALASSLNVPAVKALDLVGVETALDTLAGFGLSNLRTADFYGPSLALGSVDVALWDLVNAYRTLWSGGVWTPLRLDPEERVTARHRALSAAAAFLVSDILSDRESRSRTFSLESPLATRYWSAVKTGTSKDMRDNWCIGYSSRYTVGVWVGNFSGEPMWNVTGITGAAPVWVEVMNALHAEARSGAPATPAGIVASGAPRREWFLSGTESPEIWEAAAGTVPRIVYPAAGAVVALDPDIPRDRQKLFFEASPREAGLVWRLDGEALDARGGIVLWSPRAGRHRLQLVDPSSRVLDAVEFEVRGDVGLTSGR
jgi:penicillin-binding protein 1C